MKLLLIEDSNRLPASFGPGLRKAGHAVDATTDCEVGLWVALSIDYDLVVLDLARPSTERTAVLRRLLKERRARVLLLATKDTPADNVPDPEGGADGCLVEPFTFEELLARVQALCRQGFPPRDQRVRVGPVEIDLAKKTVRCGDEAVRLTSREFLLLECLATRRGELVTRSQIEEHLYDEWLEPASNAVDSAVCILRKKIGHPLIQTRRGLGYILP